MSKPPLYKPKIKEAQRVIIVRALRSYLFRLVEELDAKRPIGLELREEADYLEAAFMIYGRFKTRRIGRAYPYWWKSTYDSRLKEIYWELKGDEREEEKREESLRTREPS